MLLNSHRNESILLFCFISGANGILFCPALVAYIAFSPFVLMTATL